LDGDPVDNVLIN